MPRRRDRTAWYIVLLAALVAAVAGYYLPTKRAETGASMTPKEYLDLVAKKRAQRRKYAEEDGVDQPPAVTPDD